jgi:hypothetical protein
MLNSNEAANLFMDIVFKRVYSTLYPEIITKMIPEGLLPQADDPAILSDWYNKLDNYPKELVNEIIRNVILVTILNVLPILDNITGSPIKDQRSDFALYLQTYQDSHEYDYAIVFL